MSLLDDEMAPDQEAKAVAPKRAPTRAHTAPAPPPPPATLSSLQEMLEPDRTEEQERAGARGMMVAIILALVLAAAVGAGLVLFKDQIFGGASAASDPAQ
jgi:hypothetical protein